MIPVDSLLYKIDLKLNKLSTLKHQYIPVENKILALNEAQITLLKQKVDGISIVSRSGLDSFMKRYEDIQNLILNYDHQPLSLTDKKNQLHEWGADITTLTPTYLFYIDSYFLATKGRCKNRVIWVNRDLVKHGNIRMFLNNEHYKPSFEYQETLGSVSDNTVTVFTDGTFTPSKLYIMYIRFPRLVDKAGYVKLDDTESTDIDCELNAMLEDDLVDLTVERLAMYTENESAAKNAQFRLQTNE